MIRIPTEVFLAFTTNRPEFLKALRKTIEMGGATLSKETSIEIVFLMEELLKEINEDRAKTAALDKEIKDLYSLVNGSLRKLLRVQGIAKVIGTDQPLPGEKHADQEDF